MSGDLSNSGEKSFLRQHRLAVILGALVLAVVVTFVVKALNGPKTPARPTPMITMVALPPPPTPPPTPPPPPPPEQKVQEQEPEPKPDEPKPKEEPPKPPDQPPAMGSNIKGDGNDGFGLSGSGDGVVGGRGNGSRWSYYGSQVQARIAEALRGNRRTRLAAMNVKVRVWPDSTGRITRAQLAGSTGDASLDRTIQDEILHGLQLAAPPADMPTPITLRLSASRPN